MRTKSLKSYSLFASFFERDRIKVLQLTIQVIVGVGFLLLILSSIEIDAERLVQAFRNASFSLLFIALMCFGFSAVLRSLQYSVVLRGSLSRLYLTGLVLYQNALLTLLPWRIGEVSAPVLLRHDQNIPIGKSAAAILVIRCLDFFIVVLVAIVGSRNLGFRLDLSNAIYGVGTAAVLASLVLFVWRRLRRQSSFEAFVAAFKPFRNPIELGVLFVLSASVFVLSTLQSTFILQAFGLPVLLSEVALLNALTLLAALLPVHPPGGWGTIDSIQIAILLYLNYQPEHSAPVILIAHAFYTFLLIIGGSVGWILRGKSLAS